MFLLLYYRPGVDEPSSDPVDAKVALHAAVRVQGSGFGVQGFRFSAYLSCTLRVLSCGGEAAGLG